MADPEPQTNTIGASPNAQIRGRPLVAMPGLTPDQRQQSIAAQLAAQSGHVSRAPQANSQFSYAPGALQANPRGGKIKRRTNKRRKSHKKTKRHYHKYK